MPRTSLVIAAVALMFIAAVVVVPMLTAPRPAAAAEDWLDEFDKIAQEFTAEVLTEEGAHPMQAPRRMISYTPETSELNSVFAGACYALHINGNPEAVIAIENSGDPENPTTYIEISRLSGWAMNVYRKDRLVARFPKAGFVRGAYVGMMKEMEEEGREERPAEAAGATDRDDDRDVNVDRDENHNGDVDRDENHNGDVDRDENHNGDVDRDDHDDDDDDGVDDD